MNGTALAVAERTIDGTFDSRFELVVDVFQRIVADDAEGGAALAVYVSGDAVVDVWGGTADPATRRPWTRDTLAVMFSCTKALLTTCAVRASQEGRLDLDAPVAGYWPRFGSRGKERVTARMVLSHSAGLAALDADLTLAEVCDGAPVVRALEAQRPLWQPGTGHAYHAMTFGWLVAEILRRATGEPLARHFDRLFGGPDSDTWLGLPASEAARVAPAAWDRGRSALDFAPDVPGVPWMRRAATRAITLGRAFDPELVGPRSGFNDPEVLAAGIPGVGAVSTARSLARAWSTTIVPTEGGKPLLEPEPIADATRCLAEGESAFGSPAPHARWGTGYMLASELAPMLSSRSFGHDGAGGQLSFADTGADVGFAFLTNRLRNLHDRRAATVVGALRWCLGNAGQR